MTYLGIIFTGVLVNNVVLSYFLGIGPLVTASRRRGVALPVGIVSTVLATLVTLFAWMARAWILVPLGLESFEIVIVLFLSFGLGHYLGLLVERRAPRIFIRFGRYLPIAMVNSGVVGTVLVVQHSAYSFPQALVAAIAAGVGLILVSYLLATISEQLEIEAVPERLRGAPIVLISAGLIAMAFYAFDHVFLRNILG